MLVSSTDSRGLTSLTSCGLGEVSVALLSHLSGDSKSPSS